MSCEQVTLPARKTQTVSFDVSAKGGTQNIISLLNRSNVIYDASTKTRDTTILLKPGDVFEGEEVSVLAMFTPGALRLNALVRSPISGIPDNQFNMVINNLAILDDHLFTFSLTNIDTKPLQVKIVYGLDAPLVFVP